MKKVYCSVASLCYLLLFPATVSALISVFAAVGGQHKSTSPSLTARTRNPRQKILGLRLFSSSPSSSAAESSATSTTTLSTGAASFPICEYHEVKISTSQSGPPRQAVSTEDLTPIINDLLSKSKLQQGVLTVISRHTTTAITINERESRLAMDMERYFLNFLAPPDERSENSYKKQDVRYFHNDIEKRPDSAEEAQRCRDNGWNIDDPVELKAWRDQEPINAHSHLLAMLLGSSESIPVVNGKMVIGQWQSVLLVDLDGPRDRTVGIQFTGFGCL